MTVTYNKAHPYISELCFLDDAIEYVDSIRMMTDHCEAKEDIEGILSMLADRQEFVANSKGVKK